MVNVSLGTKFYIKGGSNCTPNWMIGRVGIFQSGKKDKDGLSLDIVGTPKPEKWYFFWDELEELTPGDKREETMHWMFPQ